MARNSMLARPAKAARNGAVLAMVLGALLVITMLGLALIQTVLVQHRQMQRLAERQQCFWLAEAGVLRALDRLAKSPDYSGEEWVVAADSLRAARAGVVTIAITGAADSAEGRKINVQARFPDDPVRRTLCHRELMLSTGH